jgi:hypothetical protein
MTSAGIGKTKHKTHALKISLNGLNLVGLKIHIYSITQSASKLAHKTTGLTKIFIFRLLCNAGDNNRLSLALIEKLIEDFSGISAGTKGTIVLEYDGTHFEVEFVDENGDTIDVVCTNHTGESVVCDLVIKGMDDGEYHVEIWPVSETENNCVTGKGNGKLEKLREDIITAKNGELRYCKAFVKYVFVRYRFTPKK